MKRTVTIIGGGTAGLMLAAFINTDMYDVTIYEKKKVHGRKFLVAGDGGFNLTHSEDMSNFKSRYTPASFLANALDHFDNKDFRKWLSDIGVPTFIGSSGRIFPEKGIKPIEVLKCIQLHLIEKGIDFEYNMNFIGWHDDHALVFNSDEIVQSDITVFAMGGSSWQITGSDGAWLNVFQNKGIRTRPFKASNCGYKIDWDDTFIKRYEGQPLKNIAVRINEKIQKGEMVITKFGIEGNAVYGLSPEIRSTLALKNKAVIYVDFKPTLDIPTLINKLNTSSSNTTSSLREDLKLPKAVIALIKLSLSKKEFLDVHALAHCIKNFPLDIIDVAPIDEAISTVGGVCLSAVDSNLELKALKHHYCIGEMLDWDAPTGGYLIQGSVSAGVYLAKHLNALELFSKLGS